MHSWSISGSLLLANLIACSTWAQLVTPDESARQMKVLEQFQAAVASAPDATVKFAAIAKAMKEERNVEVRRKFLKAAEAIPGPEIESLLVAVLKDDPDAGLRSDAAKLLGERGSADCLAALDAAAGNDKVTDITIGDIGGRSSARRAATFALAELASRHSQLADRVAVLLRAQPAPDNQVEREGEPDRQGLADARLQALYQVSGDEKLLKPFFARLASTDANVRIQGVVAFRFLKLRKAPVELTKTLSDSSADVRLWTALVLGEIGDPETVPALLQTAANVKEDAGVRCNALVSLSHMKPMAAAETLAKLQSDRDERVATWAAIAYHRVTGKKTKRYPEGYPEK